MRVLMHVALTFAVMYFLGRFIFAETFAGNWVVPVAIIAACLAWAWSQDTPAQRAEFLDWFKFWRR